MNQATGQWAQQQKKGLKRQDEKQHEKQAENQARRVAEGGTDDQQSQAKENAAVDAARTKKKVEHDQNERPQVQKAEGTAASPEQPSFGGRQGGDQGGKGSQSREREGMG
jgi:hypothetical protein